MIVLSAAKNHVSYFCDVFHSVTVLPVMDFRDVSRPVWVCSCDVLLPPGQKELGGTWLCVARMCRCQILLQSHSIRQTGADFWRISFWISEMKENGFVKIISCPNNYVLITHLYNKVVPNINCTLRCYSFSPS